MTPLPEKLRLFIITRAGNRCEYCGLSQAGQEASFHIDHVIPRVEGGPTAEENLALACVSCSLHKGAKQTALDPETNEQANLFNPRLQLWIDHFEWSGDTVVGVTPTGRSTIAALKMNRSLIRAIRAQERLRGRHPHIK